MGPSFPAKVRNKMRFIFDMFSYINPNLYVNKDLLFLAVIYRAVRIRRDSSPASAFIGCKTAFYE